MLPFALDRPLTVVDLETTDKRPEVARIVEIAVLQLFPGGHTKEWWSLINPGIPIPEGARAKHGITDDDVLTAPRFETVAPRIVRAFQNTDFAGYNVRYDLTVLKQEFERVGVSTENENDGPPPRILDGLRLWQLAEPRTLTDFIQRWSGKAHGDVAHRAMADVKGTLGGIVDLLDCVTHLPRDLQQLHDLQFPKDPDALDANGRLVRLNGVICFNFGKHRYQPILSQPGYLSWWMGLPDRTEEERAIVAAASRA